MKIAYNPIGESIITDSPLDNDIIFDLVGRNIWAKGIKFGINLVSSTNTASNLVGVDPQDPNTLIYDSNIHTTSRPGELVATTFIGASTNLYGGAAGSIPYQTAANTTAFLDAPTVSGYVLKYDTRTNTPYWSTDLNDKVLQGPTTASANRPLLLGYTTTAATSSITNSVLYSKNIYANPSTAQVYSNGFFQTSDEKLKNFKESINIDFEKLKQIPKKYFEWKDTPEKIEIGTSAQEVQKYFPELVSEGENGMLTVAYDKLSIIALAAVDKLYEDFNNKIATLENEISNLKKLINNLHNGNNN